MSHQNDTLKASLCNFYQNFNIHTLRCHFYISMMNKSIGQLHRHNYFLDQATHAFSMCTQIFYWMIRNGSVLRKEQIILFVSYRDFTVELSGKIEYSARERDRGISCHLYLTHRLLTPMTTFQKGKNIILSLWNFHLCRFSCTLSLDFITLFFLRRGHFLKYSPSRQTPRFFMSLKSSR